MATSGSVFSQTLQEITDTKLEELSKRRSTFEEAKASLLTSIHAEHDAVKRLAILSDGIKKCFAIKLDKENKVITDRTKHARLETELKNLDRFLDQAKCDPSVSTEMMHGWEQSLLRHLDMQSSKFQYASLYGQLVTEWLSSDKEAGATQDDDVAMEEPFEDVGNTEKLESRIEWEKMVFEPSDVDEHSLRAYLDNLFGTGIESKKAIQSALKELRDNVYSFETSISTPNQFSISSIRWVIRSLYVSDLLSDEKREVLKDFEGNDIIISEIADVLNMRLAALDSWTWTSDAPVQVEMQRKISGIYNIHMHEDLLQAIFLQYIGVKWSVFFKRVLKQFRHAQGTWIKARRNIPKIDKQRLGYYLGPFDSTPCLDSVRAKLYNSKYFMAQLMDYEGQISQSQEGEVEAEYESFVPGTLKRKGGRAKQTARKSTGGKAPRLQVGAKRHRRIAPSSDNEYSDEDDGEFDDEWEEDSKPMALKQRLLHVLSAEVVINTRLYGEATAFHSVFESWNPLLPHETICTVLEYLGVSEAWLGFFRKFLEAPLKFVDDDKSTPARKRRRGTPASHVLSDVFGETTLFCLDFAINQSTSGRALWRMHDNFWFWSRDHDVAVKAWKTVEEFTAVTGTETNPGRTGTVRVPNNPDTVLPIDKSLPNGEIRWGFLRLSPRTGKFEIDQTMVDSHIAELRKQLQDKSKSIFSFIQAWNTYAATFFTSNFGKAAACFGREHVDNMLATHERIQRQVFSELSVEEGEKALSVVDWLKKALQHRFGIEGIPDGYLYFPMELGGLDLQSPFISLLQIRDGVPQTPSEILDNFQQKESDAYERAKKSFLEGDIKEQRYALDHPDWVPQSAKDRDTFMSFDEYARHRESLCLDGVASEANLVDVFHKLLERPDVYSIDQDDNKVCTALNQLGKQSNLQGITASWSTMEAYWRWVAMMYGPEIVDRFGGLNIVDPGSLPVGMVKTFRDKRVKWQG